MWWSRLTVPEEHNVHSSITFNPAALQRSAMVYERGESRLSAPEEHNVYSSITFNPAALQRSAMFCCRDLHFAPDGGFAQKVRNPAHGSGRIVQVLSTKAISLASLIPPTAVGGYFKSALRLDLNNPPTAVGGIQNSSSSLRIEGT